MTRAVVGLAAGLDRGTFGPWIELVDDVPRSYTGAVQRAGGLAVILPVGDPGDADDHLERLDGVVLAGGACDVDPATYEADPHPRTDRSCPDRDAFELALARGALERDLAVLGICRGAQVLNVARGGTLEQHLPEALGHERHSHTPGVYGHHRVRIAEGSLAARAAGELDHAVRSYHHQGLGELAGDAVATAWDAEDGIVEAIEFPDRRFALGVLWHPEEDERSQVVRALVAAASGRPAEVAS